MHHPISKQTHSELLDALRQRYPQASKSEKSKVLDEFVAVVGCHRKHAIRLLTDTPAAAATTPAVGRRTYDEAVREALIVLWEAADRICGKRLKAILPSLITALEKHGHLALDPTVRQRLLAASPATIDRLLASYTNPPVVSQFLRNTREKPVNFPRRGIVSPGSCISAGHCVHPHQAEASD